MRASPQFFADFTHLIEHAGNDRAIMPDRGGTLLAVLVAPDDRMPDYTLISRKYG